jgi:hypothetical protein
MKVSPHLGQSYERVTARTVEQFERAAAGIDPDEDRPKPWLSWSQLPMFLVTGMCWCALVAAISISFVRSTLLEKTTQGDSHAK